MNKVRYISALSLISVCLIFFQNCEDPRPPASTSSLASETEDAENRLLAVKDLPFKPRILTQPDNYNRVQGQQVTFSVAVQDDYMPSAKIFWYHNGSKIEGKIGKTLMLKNLEAGNSGKYHAVLTIGNEILTSHTGTLTIVDLKGKVHGTGSVNYDRTNRLMNTNWSVSAFSKCNNPCGPGTKERQVACLIRPANVPTSDADCQTRKPEAVSECQGNSCTNRHSFTTYGGVPQNMPTNSAKANGEVTAVIEADSSDTAEREFSSQCDQGKLGCGSYDRCEYLQIPGFADNGDNGFCSKENGKYVCRATCSNF